MVNNFDIFELRRTFPPNEEWAITNYNNHFVIVVNYAKFFIGEIYRSSTNYYEVITASPTHCQRITVNNFYEAVIRIKKKIKES